MALADVPADISSERELLDRAAGPALDLWDPLGAGWGVLFRCRMNQITTAAPSTIHRIVFSGNAFVLGNGSGFIVERPLGRVCGNISQMRGGSKHHPPLTYERDLTFRRPGESMHRVAVLIQVPQGHQPRGYRDMAKTVNLLPIGPALPRINLE